MQVISEKVVKLQGEYIMTKKIQGIPKWPIADEREERAIKEVLDSGNWWRNAGTQTKEFEKEFAAYQGAKYGVTVANGTQALEIALKSLMIGEGDEVIVPDFTFYSTVSAVLAVKAVPVLIDVDKNTFCMSYNQVEKAITTKTKAIIPVHMAGNIADMKNIMEIAKRHDLYVIEDAAHAHGAFWNNHGAGTFGTFGTFSFQNAKLMSAGEGGAIICNDEALMHEAFLQLNCGREENDTTYQHVRIGTNARLSEVQGAILRVQLSRLDEQIALREENYKYLAQLLDGIDGITLQKIDDRMRVDPHYQVMFYYDSEAFGGKTRAELVQYLREAGIPCNRSFEAIHNLPIFKTLSNEKWRICGSDDTQTRCLSSEKISMDVVCLSHNILLGDRNLVESIADTINDFKNSNVR